VHPPRTSTQFRDLQVADESYERREVRLEWAAVVQNYSGTWHHVHHRTEVHYPPRRGVLEADTGGSY